MHVQAEGLIASSRSPSLNSHHLSRQSLFPPCTFSRFVFVSPFCLVPLRPLPSSVFSPCSLPKPCGPCLRFVTFSGWGEWCAGDAKRDWGCGRLNCEGGCECVVASGRMKTERILSVAFSCNSSFLHARAAKIELQRYLCRNYSFLVNLFPVGNLRWVAWGSLRIFSCRSGVQLAGSCKHAEGLQRC